MAETEFSVFAQRLSTKYRRGQKVEAFTQELLEKIYLADTAFFADYETRTFRAYYYGQNDISEIAQKIADDLDPDGFAGYLDTGSEDAISYLCDAFREWCPDIAPDNYVRRVAERFVTIINNAAAPKTKKRLSNQESQTSVFDPSPKDKYGTVLVAEVGSMCPGEGCPNQLYVRANGHLELCYDVVVIDSTCSNDEVSNLIAMCPTCAAKYRADHKQSMQWLLTRKQQLQDSYDDRELSSPEIVQEGVRRLLQKIPQMKLPQDVDFNYDPVPVRQKIEDDNVELFIRVKGQVNAYYSEVHEALQDLGKEGLLRFKPFCAQVRKLYLEYAEKGYDQPKIYREMTRWLYDGTLEDWDYCQIVISYFIQKCEVFDVIAE